MNNDQIPNNCDFTMKIEFTDNYTGKTFTKYMHHIEDTDKIVNNGDSKILKICTDILRQTIKKYKKKYIKPHYLSYICTCPDCRIHIFRTFKYNQDKLTIGKDGYIEWKCKKCHDKSKGNSQI
ncbi:hypothetical protein [Clostridium sp.]|uniref:hypothetical protein n=1 Tax=Clostridium sp. TaxID=1506 RepID=UPI0032168874